MAPDPRVPARRIAVGLISSLSGRSPRCRRHPAVLAEADGRRAVGISSQIGWFRAETDKLGVNPHADILMTVNPLFVRLRVPADADTLAGMRLVSEREREPSSGLQTAAQ